MIQNVYRYPSLSNQRLRFLLLFLSELQSFIFFQVHEGMFLCVNNINSTTSEKNFSLYLEQRAGGDADIVSVVYTKDRSTAVVEFSTSVGMCIAHYMKAYTLKLE